MKCLLHDLHYCFGASKVALKALANVWENFFVIIELRQSHVTFRYKILNKVSLLRKVYMFLSNYDVRVDICPRKNACCCSLRNKLVAWWSTSLTNLVRTVDRLSIKALFFICGCHIRCQLIINEIALGFGIKRTRLLFMMSEIIFMRDFLAVNFIRLLIVHVYGDLRDTSYFLPYIKKFK